MAAKCYWCTHSGQLKQKVRPGNWEPVGVCNDCGVHACDNHGQRGSTRFRCLRCIPPLVKNVGCSNALGEHPDLIEKLLAEAHQDKEDFKCLSAEEGANLLSALILEQWISPGTMEVDRQG